MNRQQLAMTDKEVAIVAKFLAALREAPPRNGSPAIIIVTQTQHTVSVCKASPKGKVDLQIRK